jgi:hypothetical protein
MLLTEDADQPTMLRLWIIPAAAADTGNCGQKDRHQFDWQTFLEIMLILIAIAALIAAASNSGGGLVPVTAKAISALILAVSPLAAALAAPAGSTCATFFVGTVSAGG